MKTPKELKAEYKQRKFAMGVYQIRNTVNGKIFIGSSVNLDAIFNRHRIELTLGSHRIAELQRDWKEFGEESFAFEILAEVEEKEGADHAADLKQLEAMFIEDLSPFDDKGYHTRKAASSAK